MGRLGDLRSPRFPTVFSKKRQFIFFFEIKNNSIDSSKAGIAGIPTEEIKAGNYSDVPVLMGTNSNEVIYWVFLACFSQLFFNFFFFCNYKIYNQSQKGVTFVGIIPAVTNFSLPLTSSTAFEVASIFFGGKAIAQEMLTLYDHYLDYESAIAGNYICKKYQYRYKIQNHIFF